MKKLLSTFILAFLANLAFAIMLPEGTDARLADITFENDVIKSVVLSEPTELNTPLGKIEATGKVEFYSNGTISKLYPNKIGSFQTPIGNFVYQQYEEIEFYENGNLHYLILAEPTIIKINNESFKINKGVFLLYEEWHPASFELVEEKKLKFPFGDVVIAKDTFVMFYSDGNIAAFTVNGPTEIQTNVGKIIVEGNIGLGPDLKLGFMQVLKSDGLETKYGKVFPVQGSTIYFSPDGNVAEVTPQDIMVCTIDNVPVMTKAREVISFDDEGNLISGTLKNTSLKYKDWNITFYGDSNRFIIYKGDKLYIPYGLVKEINNISYEKKTTRFLLLEDCYYSWSPELGYRDKTEIYVKKKDVTGVKLFKEFNNGAISHFKKDSKEIDIWNCPLIFDENNQVIGYRKANTTENYFDSYWDQWRTKSYYNSVTDEYVDYTEDVYFEEK